MASFSKKYGKWQARVSYYDMYKKRHTKSKNGFKTKREAQAWAADIKSQLNKGYKVTKDISFYDYYTNWVKTYKEPKTADTTLIKFNQAGKFIKKFFGATNIKGIDRLQYQEFINWYGETRSPNTVKRLHNIVRQAVKSAILDDYIIKDFTQRVEVNGDPSKALRVQYLNVKEIKQLLDYLVGKHNHYVTSRYMIITAIYTGMRLSEIQALTWSDIDWIHQTISINKSWNDTKKAFKPTKNKYSVRTIKVNKELLDVLEELRKYTKSTMVFRGPYGTIPTSQSVNEMLHKSLDELNLHKKDFHFHSLRHSHVALLLSKGVDLYAISKRLGHSDMTTTSKVYAYLISEYKERTDNEIVDALSSL